MLIRYTIERPGHIGRAIRARRRALRLTQQDLAHAADAHLLTIRRHEREDSVMIDQDLVERLAVALGTTTDLLWRDAAALPKKKSTKKQNTP